MLHIWTRGGYRAEGDGLEGGVQPGGECGTAWAPSPELADGGRSARRVLRLGLRWTRADKAPTLAGLLGEHLGPKAAAVLVVAETRLTYERVNLQVRYQRLVG
ncbi:MAG: hypothetical protein ACRENX_09585 [Candidatus Dormibacteria bacterium]